ncbi:SDR family oxidoreductase [Bdellovibrionota bacterium FG-1]
MKSKQIGGFFLLIQSFKIIMKILITGASSGFGQLALPLLLQRNHTVIAAIRGGPSRLKTLFEKELKQYPDHLFAIDVHMERAETLAAAKIWIDEQWDGKLDVLINNAGYGLFGALEDLHPDQLKHQLEVNLVGTALLTRELLPALRAARGRIINVSSIVGLVSFPFYGAYSASKFALEGLSEGLYYELKPHGVQVCLVEPGGFATDFSLRSRVFASAVDSPYGLRARALEDTFETSSSRLADPLKVARLLVNYCEKSRLPFRTLVGLDAHFMAFMRWFLPTRFRMTLIYWAFRIFVFKD